MKDRCCVCGGKARTYHSDEGTSFCRETNTENLMEFYDWLKMRNSEEPSSSAMIKCQSKFEEIFPEVKDILPKCIISNPLDHSKDIRIY